MLLNIPEIAGLSSRKSIMRIPPEMDIPITPRVRRLIDTAEFHRLTQINQLGLVSLVYPGARHTRFEHSLGVYRLALRFLQRFASDDRFTSIVSDKSAELFIAAALLHDVGHWPYCHLVEDMNLPGVKSHEQVLDDRISQSEIADCLKEDWGIVPSEITRLLLGNCTSLTDSLLESMISGPIDIDKMDYLYRDSLHAGVPYGRHFDRERLIGSLCLNKTGDKLAISDKGRTAAELMVFARYVMFSEVYWHHTVRSATAMLQRAFYLLWDKMDLREYAELSDYPFQQRLLRQAQESSIPATVSLLDSLFGSHRKLYKGIKEFSILEDSEIVRHLSQKPFEWLVRCSQQFAQLASAELSIPIGSHQVIIDAPPVTKEVQFKVDIYFPKDNKYRPLQQVSPAVNALATEQFDDYVKRTRIFVAAELVNPFRNLKDCVGLLEKAANLTE